MSVLYVSFITTCQLYVYTSTEMHLLYLKVLYVKPNEYLLSVSFSIHRNEAEDSRTLPPGHVYIHALGKVVA